MCGIGWHRMGYLLMRLGRCDDASWPRCKKKKRIQRAARDYGISMTIEVQPAIRFGGQNQNQSQNRNQEPKTQQSAVATAMRCDAHGLDQFQCLLASVRWPRELQRIWIAIENYGAWMEWPAAKEKCRSCRFPYPRVCGLEWNPASQPFSRSRSLSSSSSTQRYMCLYVHTCTLECTYLTLESWVWGLAFLRRWDTLRYKFMQINAGTSLFCNWTRAATETFCDLIWSGF